MTDTSRSPTPPRSPRQLVRWSHRLAADVWSEYRADKAGDLAASITFWSILSIPAAALALVSTLSSLEAIAGATAAQDVEERIQRFVAETLVDSDTLASAIHELFAEPSAGIATVAATTALFTLARAFAGLIRAMDVAYEVDEGRSWWRLRLVAIAFGIGTIAITAATATFLALLPALPLGPVARWSASLVAFGVLVLWCSALFHLAPNHRTPWRYDVPGAIVTALGWIVASQSFAWYVRFSGGGNQVQSSVGAVLLALTLMYLLSVVLVVGAEVNDVIARRAGVVQQPRSTLEQARSLRARVRGVRRSST